MSLIGSATTGIYYDLSRTSGVLNSSSPTNSARPGAFMATTASAVLALVTTGCGRQPPPPADRHDLGCAQALKESEHRAHKMESISCGAGLLEGVVLTLIVERLWAGIKNRFITTK